MEAQERNGLDLGEAAGFVREALLSGTQFPPRHPQQGAQRAVQNSRCHIFPQKNGILSKFPLYE